MTVSISDPPRLSSGERAMVTALFPVVWCVLSVGAIFLSMSVKASGTNVEASTRLHASFAMTLAYLPVVGLVVWLLHGLALVLVPKRAQPVSLRSAAALSALAAAMILPMLYGTYVVLARLYGLRTPPMLVSAGAALVEFYSLTLLSAVLVARRRMIF